MSQSDGTDTVFFFYKRSIGSCAPALEIPTPAPGCGTVSLMIDAMPAFGNTPLMRRRRIQSPAERCVWFLPFYDDSDLTSTPLSLLLHTLIYASSTLRP